jgi:hypothetical protein
MRRVRSLGDDSETRLQAAARLREGIGQLLGELDTLAELSRRGLSLSRELGGVIARRGDPGTCLRGLDEVDEKILEVSARNVAGFLIQSVIHGIAGQGEGAAKPQEVVARSVSMYEGIAESAGWQKGLLSRAMSSLREQT